MPSGNELRTIEANKNAKLTGGELDMTKTRKGHCFTCDCEREGAVVSKEKTVLIKGVKIKTTVHCCVCPECGDVFYDKKLMDEDMKVGFDLYKKTVGLLTSGEIKAIRKSYGYSATKFAMVLGLGAKTITRYEGGAIQSQEVDNLIRLAAKPDNLALLLETYDSRHKPLTV